jgi:hypothetical protein
LVSSEVLFYPATAQSSEGAAHFSISTNLVKVPVSVFDERGLMTTNLLREDFRL